MALPLTQCLAPELLFLQGDWFRFPDQRKGRFVPGSQETIGKRSRNCSREKMLRITRIEGRESSLTFKLEGQLLEPWVIEVLKVCAADGSRAGDTSLDLSGLTFVDQAGARLLRDLVHRGIGISAASGFVAELLRLEDS
jgi:hypothetical protein